MMKKIFILIFFVLPCCSAHSQQVQELKVRKNIDSIIRLIKVEPNDEKKVKLVLSIYTVSVDGYQSLLLDTYKTLYAFSQEKKDIALESSAWSFAGQAYRLSGNYVKALECHYKAVALAEKTRLPLLLGYARNQMAHIYKDRHENEKALSLYRQSAMDYESGGASGQYWWAYMNMGAVYLNMGQLDSSLFYSLKANSQFPIYNTEASYTYILANIGSVYSLKGNVEKANEYFSKAMGVAEKYQSARYINTATMALAEHFYRFHHIDSSIYYAKKAVSAVEGSVISNLALAPAKLLANIYQNISADSSLKYMKVYLAANDSLYSIRTNQQLMMMSFDDDRKKQEFVNEQKAYRNKIFMTGMIAVLGVAALVMFVLYRNNRQRKKVNDELQKTLTDLKSTQTQLIQAEKMASLGELTAGIAHEIQNPLNFVNNFSEVNKELLVEIKEKLQKGNYADANEIIENVIANEEKINHHGKRADAIVKGMLQHSSSGSGRKEPTDINKLADEYLRLAYHGLRAKDKTFNATLKTDYDESIGNVNIVPQDIGRVILNLITNAFYAVNEYGRPTTGDRRPIVDGKPYEPMVSVSTKRTGNKIGICISDNGGGIPKEIIDKIFQPFFTTKPTGQGTGLGLSLAYDIVRAHGGEIKVKTAENDGTTFIIQLPV